MSGSVNRSVSRSANRSLREPFREPIGEPIREPFREIIFFRKAVGTKGLRERGREGIRASVNAVAKASVLGAAESF